MRKILKHQSTNSQSINKNDTLENKILAAIKDNPGISQIELAERIGLTRRIVQRKMNELKSARRIIRTGGKRYGKWELR